jgi:hypothetical protein
MRSGSWQLCNRLFHNNAGFGFKLSSKGNSYVSWDVAFIFHLHLPHQLVQNNLLEFKPMQAVAAPKEKKLQSCKLLAFLRYHHLWSPIRNLPTSGLDSGSSWLDGVNGILMQQEPDSPKQDYWNRRAIASLANTLITVMEPVPMPLLSSMPLLQL